MSVATAGKKVWTLRDLASLPDDGNKYEVIHGELFVTPAPRPKHELILGRLTQILVPFVAANRLGLVQHPRAVVRFQGSEAEPDLMVRQLPSSEDVDWEEMPTPSLVVEVISPFTRRRDHEDKKEFYIDAGVAESWIVDPENRNVAVVDARGQKRIEQEKIEWRPAGTPETLSFRVAELFAGTAPHDCA